MKINRLIGRMAAILLLVLVALVGVLCFVPTPQPPPRCDEAKINNHRLAARIQALADNASLMTQKWQEESRQAAVQLDALREKIDADRERLSDRITSIQQELHGLSVKQDRQQRQIYRVLCPGGACR